MANYDLEVSNSGAYNPLALQAFAEVQQGLTDQYNTSMAAYGELESKANLLEKLANDVKGKDSIAYQNYMNYANALRQHTDTLATYGINPNLTRNLMQARSDYSRIIHPIEEAWQARQNEAKRQAEYLKAHPGTMFEKDASKMGIDEWLKNPTYQAQSVDLDNVSKIAGERFEAIKNKLQQFVSEAQAGGLDPATATAEDVKRWCKVKGVPYLYDAIEKYGANPDDVRALLSGDPRMMNSMLQHIVDETMAQTGVNTWNTDYDHYTKAQNEQNRRNIFERARGAIAGEATKSIGTDKFDKYQDNISGDLAYKYAALRETARHNKAMEDLAKDKNSGGGSGQTPKTISLTTERDNFIYNGMTRDKANEAVVQSRLPEKYRNESMMRVIESMGLTEDIINGTVDLNDPKVMDKIEKAYNEGKGDIGWLEAKWEGLKNLGKLWTNSAVVGGKTVLGTTATLNPVGIVGTLAGGLGRMIFGGQDAKDAFSNTILGGYWKNLTDSKVPFEWEQSLKNVELFNNYDLMGKNDKITVETENGPVEMNKHEYSTYVMKQTGLDERDMKTMKEMDKEIGYDPEKDKDITRDFAYSYAVMRGANNAGDWRLNEVTNEAQNSLNNVIRNHNTQGVQGAFALSKRAGNSDTLEKLDDKDLELINKNDLGLMTRLYDDKGTIKNEIVVSAGKDADGNDIQYTLELPKEGRAIISDELSKGLKYYNMSTNLNELKDISESEWEEMQREYMVLYNHTHHIGKDNPFNIQDYENTINVGAAGLLNQMSNIYMRGKNWANLDNNKQRELLQKAFIADQLSKAHQNNALISTYAELNKGDDDSHSTTGGEYGKVNIDNDYINFN